MFRPLGRLVCKLRGFHRSMYVIEGFHANMTVGSILPCKSCGEMAAKGPVRRSWIEIAWEPERPEDIDREMRDIMKEIANAPTKFPPE
jgi:hypothetical protein